MSLLITVLLLATSSLAFFFGSSLPQNLSAVQVADSLARSELGDNLQFIPNLSNPLFVNIILPPSAVYQLSHVQLFILHHLSLSHAFNHSFPIPSRLLFGFVSPNRTSFLVKRP